jgi:tetratricopeptide (TPR) repeat protein
MNLGVTLNQAGRPDDADAAFRRSAGVHRELIREAPGLASPSDDYANMLCWWAELAGPRLPLDKSLALLDEAGAAAEAALAAADARSEYRETLARVLVQRGHALSNFGGDAATAAESYRRAAEIARDCLGRAPGSPRLRNQLLNAVLGCGRNLLACGKLDEAKPFYDEVLKTSQSLFEADPKNPEASYGRAVVLKVVAVYEFRCGRSDAAIALTRQAFDIAEANDGRHPHNIDFVLGCAVNLGIMLQKDGRGTEADGCYTRVVERATRDATDDARRARMIDARIRFATFLLEDGRMVECARELDDAADRLDALGDDAPGVWRALHDRYWAVKNLVAYMADGPHPAMRDPRRAVGFARMALEHTVPASRGPNDVDAKMVWGVLGRALVQDGQWKEGLTAYAKHHELGCIDDPADWLHEALAHAHLGEIDAARELFDRAVAKLDSEGNKKEWYVRRRAAVEALLVPAEKR